MTSSNRQVLTQKQQQRLSPRQLQVIKLIEYSVLELEEKVKREIEENPALEEGREDSREQAAGEAEDAGAEETVAEGPEDEGADELMRDDADDYLSGLEDDYGYRDDYSDEPYELQSSAPREMPDRGFSLGTGFTESLQEQLGLLDVSEDTKKICLYIIGNLDDEGYLRREVSQLADDINLNSRVKVSETQVFEALDIVQQLDPAGVGARDLRECLMLQLQRKPLTTEVDNAMRILEEAFDEFALKHYDKIRSRLSISDAALKAAVAEILKLNPKPGNSASEGSMAKNSDAITPDFLYDSESGVLTLNNKDIPPLRISRTYRNLFEDYGGNEKNRTASMREAVAFAKQKVDSAKSFIDALKQREDTLLKVMRSIIQLQKEYFETGEESSLRPMTMKDVAELSQVDISTVSRVSSSKYVQTDFGIYSLKHFFSEGIMTSSGEEVSNKEIKRILRECIDAEDKSRPLPDESLCDILRDRGYIIARRTVAKYREQLGLPVARLRRKL